MKIKGKRPANAGLSMLEVLAVLAGLAILVSVAAVTATNVQDRVRHEKLVRDVRQLNTAIQIYQSNGGVLPSGSDPAGVINKLKSTATDFEAEGIAGLTGRFVDPRLNPVYMTSSELASGDPRAVWNDTKKQFEIAMSGAVGGLAVKSFSVEQPNWWTGVINNYFASQKEERPNRALELAHDSTWVWDYEDTSAAPKTNPTTVPLNPGMTPTASGLPPGMSQLAPPVFSVPGGMYPLGEFDKSVTLTNPNSPLVSELLYSTSLGSWTYYDGSPIAVPPGTTVTAFARSLNPSTWVDSVFADESYMTSPVQLNLTVAAPAAITYFQAGGVLMPGSPAAPAAATATVTLNNPSEIPSEYMTNDTWNVYWTYNGTSPLDAGDEAIDQQASGAGPAWLFSGPDFSGSFPPLTIGLGLANWTAATLPLKIAAISTNQETIVNSTLSTNTISKNVLALRPPQVSTGGGLITMTPVTAYGDMPAGAQIYYTTDGTDPGNNGSGGPVTGTLYSGPFNIAGNPCIGLTVMARVYPPAAYASWFNVSANTSVSIPVAPTPGSPQAVAYGFENSTVSRYAVLGLQNGKLEASGSAQIWGNLGIGPSNRSDLDPIKISGEYHVDPTYVSDKNKVYDIVTNNLIAPKTVNLAQAQADAVSLSTTSKALTATQTFVKIDNTLTINSTASNGFNVIKVQEISLNNKTLTLNGSADKWYIFTISKKLKLEGTAKIALTGGIQAAHVLFNMESGADPVEIKGTALFVGTLLAPSTQVKVTNSGVVNGVIVSGKDTQVKDTAVVQAAGNGFACQGAPQTPIGSGGGIPLELAFSAPATINYAQAGGSIMAGGTPPAPVGPAMITLTNAAAIDDAFENSGIFRVYWTLDGTDPKLASSLTRYTGDPFGGGFPGQPISLALSTWGSESSKDFKIAATSFDTNKVTDSSVLSQSVALERTDLRAPTITESGGTVTMALVTSFGDMPTGARIYYTTNGAYIDSVNGEPSQGTLYTGPFALNGSNSDACGKFNIVARVFGPSGYTNWFRTSPSASLVLELSTPPTAGSARRFVYDYSKTKLDDYAVIALKKLDTDDKGKVFGNVAVGPNATRKLDPLSLGGSYHVDPTSNKDKDNAFAIEGGAPVTPTTVNLTQVAADVVSLAAKAAALTPTQTFGVISTSKTITSTASDNVNVIKITELRLKDEARLTLSGPKTSYFILNITNKFEFDDGSISLTGGIEPAHVIIYLWAAVGDVQLKGDGNLSGTLLATNSKVELMDEVNITGSMIVANKDLKIEDEATIGSSGGNFSFDCSHGTGGAPIPPENLSVPLFSKLGGSYPSNEFPFNLTLTNPNAAGSSTIQYSVNGGGFSLYNGGAISVAAGSTIQAFCATTDPGKWASSATASHTYTAGANKLLDPAISPSADKFDYGANATITVTVTNPNAPALGTLKYRVDNGTWKNYTGPFNLSVTNYASKTAIIDAQVVTANPSWLSSGVAHAYLLSAAPIPLDKPLLGLTPSISTGPDGTTVTITNPNEPGVSDIQFVLVPIPSVLGCDIIHGVAPPPGTWMTYSGPIEVPDSAYPSGFAVIAYSRGIVPGYTNSATVVDYDTSDTIGLRGGHFDVDTTSRTKYATVYPNGGGTDRHTHEYDNKHNTVIIDMFDMANGSHARVQDNVLAGEMFKITVVNANLSPMAHICINQNANYAAPYVFAYDDIPFASLPTYSLDGVSGTIQLTKLSIVFDEDAIVNAGLLPSNTGDVKGNTPGKGGEWRNGALTIQIVKVDASGNPVGGALDTAKSNGSHGVGRAGGVLHELTVFWHWPGASYHNSANPYVPMSQSSILSGLDNTEEPVCNF